LDVDLPEITGLPGSTSGLLSTSEIGSLLQPRGEDKLPNVDELPDVDVTRPSKLQIQDLIPTGEVGGDDGGEFDRLFNVDSGAVAPSADASNALARLLNLEEVEDDEEDEQVAQLLADALFATNPQEELLRQFSTFLSDQIRSNATPEVVAGEVYQLPNEQRDETIRYLTVSALEGINNSAGGSTNPRWEWLQRFLNSLQTFIDNTQLLTG